MGVRNSLSLADPPTGSLFSYRHGAGRWLGGGFPSYAWKHPKGGGTPGGGPSPQGFFCFCFFDARAYATRRTAASGATVRAAAADRRSSVSLTQASNSAAGTARE
jgi:hypothetical protein